MAKVLPQAGDHSGSKIYSPLPTDQKAFRLLTLKPGKRDELITCSLHLSRLDVEPTPEYETISYCWGDANVRDVVKVGKILVSVPASSVAALRRVRLQDSPRIVWIDAICINQDDFDECSSQVLLMRDLFASGSRGLVYLGEDDMVDAFRAVRLIVEDLGSVELFSNLAAMRSLDQLPRLMQTDEQTFTGNYSDVGQQALVRLYSLEWFCRVWTYQEAILAQNSICFSGPCVITLLEIIRCAVVLQRDTDYLDFDVVQISARIIDLSWHIEPAFQDFTQSDLPGGFILEALASKKCSIPVDRIYGMLGVLSELEIMPDYSKPTIQVFTEATRVLIAYDRSLYLLCLASESGDTATMPTDDTESRIPSWVPRLWGPVGELDLEWATVKWSCNAGKRRGFDPSIQVGDCPSHILRTSGFVVGSIARLAVDETNAVIWEGGNLRHVPSRFLRFLEQFAADTVDSRQSSTKNGNLYGVTQAEAELATIICDGTKLQSTLFVGFYLRKWKAMTDFLHTGRGHWLFRNRSSEADADFSSLEFASQLYRDEFSLFLDHWRLASTNSSLLGIVPRAAGTGDIIVILYGLDCPAVLRPVGDRYLFIGTTWFYGIMNGEAVDRHESAGGVDKIFELC